MPQALAVEVSNNLPNTYGKIDITEAFKMRFQKHLTYKEIADKMGVAAPSVHGALKRFLHILHNPEESATYEQNRAQILTAVEFRLVNQLANKKKIKAASLNNIAYAVSQINNMIRLEKGQPTAITEHLDADLGGMIDQLCGMKSAGSGSTTVSITPQSEPIDILASLEAPNEPIPTQAPDDNRSNTEQPEATVPPVQPTKSAKPRKPRTAKPTKSATNSRKQNTSNITKEWYE
jgi:predicted DNA-binding protein YlxM (UPF0122 family)